MIPKLALLEDVIFLCFWNRKDMYSTPPQLMNDWEDVEMLHPKPETLWQRSVAGITSLRSTKG